MNTTHQRLAEWLIKRAEAGRGDISLLIGYGSAFNQTSGARSDLDCYFVPANANGEKFALDFIIDDVGYDIYAMSEKRLGGIAALEESLTPCVGEGIVLYSRDDEASQYFRQLQDTLKSNLRDSEHCRRMAKKRFDIACALERTMRSSNDECEAVKAAGYILMFLSECAALLCGEYFHYGLKKQYEELSALSRSHGLPEGFLKEYQNVIYAAEEQSRFSAASRMLDLLADQNGWLRTEKELPTAEAAVTKADYSALARDYEELCSAFNKIYAACEQGDVKRAFLSAVCLQNELDEMERRQAPPLKILHGFRPDKLAELHQITAWAAQELSDFIERGGGMIKRYRDFEEFLRAKL